MDASKAEMEMMESIVPGGREQYVIGIRCVCALRFKKRMLFVTCEDERKQDIEQN
jgi:hypothetical protein